MQLNQQQQQAIEHTGSHQLIVAGPGTGKTHTLTQKILRLLRAGTSPAGIMAITFTTKAAQEMQERLEHDTKQMPFVGTFHALALRILKTRGHNFFLLQPKQQDEILDRIASKLNKKQKKEFKRVITLAKNQILPFEEIDTFLEPDQVRETYDKYAETLDAESLIDFDDLLLKGLEHLKQSDMRPEHLFVDEYQDINEIQYRFIRVLAGEHTKIYAIGDPDQSIYAFRGSNIQHFLRFEQDFPDTHRVTLTENYRSTPQVLAAANTLIQNNTERLDKTVTATGENGSAITLHPFETEWQEGRFITKEIARLVGGTDMIQSHTPEYSREYGIHSYHFPDIVVLYRTRAQARVIEECLKKDGIPYQCISSIPWYQKEEVQSLLQYLQYLQSPGAQHDIPEPQKILLNNYVREHRDLSTSKPSDMINKIVQYLKLEEHHDDGSPRAHRKLQNLKAFMASAAMFDAHSGEAGLQNLLDHYALLQEYDHYNPQAKAVSLMTLHAAKGLEFPVVFIAGLEDGLLPFRKEGEKTNIEEERRLFYVGITRAKEKLYLSYAVNRNKTPVQPSSFLTEIEPHVSRQDMPVSRKKQPDNQASLF